MKPMSDLPELLDALDPKASLVQRHLWLIALFQWFRGDCSSVAATISRIKLFLDAMQARSEALLRLSAWWQTLLETVDGTALLADYGFISRSAFVSEFAERLRQRLLPGTPETADASALFSLVLFNRFDAQWLDELDDAMLVRIAALLESRVPAEGNKSTAGISSWQGLLLEAITFCTSQVRAAGFSSELRLRMSVPAREAEPFHYLASDFERLRNAVVASPTHDSEERRAALQQFSERLAACRHAVASVYTHLNEHGISVNLVFQLRQMRERARRIRGLLDCLLSNNPPASAARLFSQLVVVGEERRSLLALIDSNTSMLAVKMVERSSEAGERYIARTAGEYRTMLRNAAGGGAITAVTTWMKFAVMAFGLTAFWNGFWASLVYAASFIVIQLLHFTLATKQPAMTAPAMAAKLKDLDNPLALGLFVDAVTQLVRSQVAAVLGNVLLVFPVVILISVTMQLALGHAMLDAAEAQYVLRSLTLLGPTILFAAFTGVLLFASSIIAGWVENWFALHRLDSAMRYNPRITATLGADRANRWATFLRANISGLASNISLGFMLGLIPAFTGFFGLALEVRHVTLSAGQLGAACAALGWDVVGQSALWWCVVAIPVIGSLNLAVSFYLALRLALRAHNVTPVTRAQIREVIWRRWRDAPLSFLWPPKEP